VSGPASIFATPIVIEVVSEHLPKVSVTDTMYFVVLFKVNNGFCTVSEFNPAGGVHL